MSRGEAPTLVVGGSSGMGLALARLLVESGSTVVIAGRSEERLEQALRSISSPAASGVALDASDEESVRSFFSSGRLFSHIVATAADTTGA
jgi:NAD(P)-dependent dehydrogenase (short-subunit alcohol dehydrogenase family)